MKKLLLAGLLLICGGCGSSGYGGKYTLYRSRMMLPPGVKYEQDICDHFHGPEDPDECQYLSHAYRSWQP